MCSTGTYAIRTQGDWEGWLAFFLEGVASAALAAERGVIALARLPTNSRVEMATRAVHSTG